MANELLPPITEDDRMLSGLVYPLWPIIGPIILNSSKREEPYLHFNAWQAIALGGGSLAVSLVVFLISLLIFHFLPGSQIALSAVLGLGIFALVMFAVIFYLSVVIFIAWRVANGKFLRLPFIGTWAEKRMQTNLNLTAESYSSAIIGERVKRKLSQFDYKSAPGYREEEETENPEVDSDESRYNPDTDSYEYVSDASSVGDLLSYERPKENESLSAPPNRAVFQPHIPGAAPKSKNQSPSGNISNSVEEKQTDADGFKPLTGKRPGVSPRPSFGNMTRIDESGFKPLAPKGSRPTSEPVIAGRPLPKNSGTAVSESTTPASSSELSSRNSADAFKPLVPTGATHSASRTAPKFQWSQDFSEPKEHKERVADAPASAPASQNSSGFKFGLSTAIMPPSSTPPPPAPQNGGSEFKRGLTPSQRTSSRTVEAPRFRWDELEDK